MLTYDQVVASVAKGLKHRVVMPIDFSNGGDAIVADASVQSVADFKGKKVGFNQLSPSDFMLAYALQQNGMSDKDIDAVKMNQRPEERRVGKENVSKCGSRRWP